MEKIRLRVCRSREKVQPLPFRYAKLSRPVRNSPWFAEFYDTAGRIHRYSTRTFSKKRASQLLREWVTGRRVGELGEYPVLRKTPRSPFWIGFFVHPEFGEVCSYNTLTADKYQAQQLLNGWVAAGGVGDEGGSVYVLQDGLRVKIGFSIHWEARFGAHRFSNLDLIKLAHLPCNHSLKERQIHRRFAEYRIVDPYTTEWFHLTPEVAEWIATETQVQTWTPELEAALRLA